jgi:hypothetical protein
LSSRMTVSILDQGVLPWRRRSGGKEAVSHRRRWGDKLLLNCMKTLLGRLLCAAWCVCSRSAAVIDEPWRSFFIFSSELALQQAYLQICILQSTTRKLLRPMTCQSKLFFVRQAINRFYISSHVLTCWHARTAGTYLGCRGACRRLNQLA